MYRRRIEIVKNRIRVLHRTNRGMMEVTNPQTGIPIAVNTTKGLFSPNFLACSSRRVDNKTIYRLLNIVAFVMLVLEIVLDNKVDYEIELIWNCSKHKERERSSKENHVKKEDPEIKREHSSSPVKKEHSLSPKKDLSVSPLKREIPSANESDDDVPLVRFIISKSLQYKIHTNWDYWEYEIHT